MVKIRTYGKVAENQSSNKHIIFSFLFLITLDIWAPPQLIPRGPGAKNSGMPLALENDYMINKEEEIMSFTFSFLLIKNVT